MFIAVVLIEIISLIMQLVLARWKREICRGTWLDKKLLAWIKN